MRSSCGLNSELLALKNLITVVGLRCKLLCRAAQAGDGPTEEVLRGCAEAYDAIQWILTFEGVRSNTSGTPSVHSQTARYPHRSTSKTLSLSSSGGRRLRRGGDELFVSFSESGMAVESHPRLTELVHPGAKC